MIVAPSILALDFSKFEETLEILNQNVDWLHFDVMDGNFVKNISFGPDILKAFRRTSSLYLDTHIMVADPFYYVEKFSDVGADGITFHFEALNNDVIKCKELIKLIKSKYIRAGISIKPDTPVELLKPLLNDIDLILIMSVEPGFGGQEFKEESYQKIDYLNEYRKENNLNYLIEVDGGINDKNAYELIQKGVDILVSGTYIFDGDIVSNINKLKNCEK